MSEESLVDFLGTVEILSVFDAAELEQLADASESRFFKFGEAVCNTGDREDGLYVIKAGAVRIFSEENGKEISMGVRKVGDVFAELAMLREYRHESSVRSSGKTELLHIPRSVFAKLLEGNDNATGFITSYVAISSAGGVVSRLFDLRDKVEKGDIEQIIRSVGVKRVVAGQTVLEQGNSQDHRLYVVRQGEVKVVRSEGGVDYPIATLQQGEVFGEKACLMRQEQPATVAAVTDTVLLVIPERTVYLILERNPKLKDVLEERIHFTERELERQKKLAARRRRPVLLDLKSKPEFGERVIKRFPLIEQAEEMDCGAACLAMICKHYGIPITLGKLREMANVTLQGATLDSLARVGESLGFTTRGVQCTYDSLLGFELPLIAHWEGYHYIIVYGISKTHVWHSSFNLTI